MGISLRSFLSLLALSATPIDLAFADTGPGGTILPMQPGIGLFASRPVPPTTRPSAPASIARANSGPPQPMPATTVPPQGTPLRIPPTPGLQCRQAIRAAEQAAAIPSQLMAAIGRIESGRRDSNGVVHPWPWSINAEGVDHVFGTKAEALAAVRAMQARGMKSIDIGCMQVNLMYHPKAFASLEQAFDPAANATYAARYLNELFTQTGSWTKATAAYHSATPERGTPYQQKVAAIWPEEKKQLAITPGAGGNVWTNNAFTANAFNTGVAGGGNQLSNNVNAARIIPAAPGAIGRDLAAYRNAPIGVTRLPAQLAQATARPPS